jgi:hypothetical protein
MFSMERPVLMPSSDRRESEVKYTWNMLRFKFGFCPTLSKVTPLLTLRGSEIANCRGYFPICSVCCLMQRLVFPRDQRLQQYEMDIAAGVGADASVLRENGCRRRMPPAHRVI